MPVAMQFKIGEAPDEWISKKQEYTATNSFIIPSKTSIQSKDNLLSTLRYNIELYNLYPYLYAFGFFVLLAAALWLWFTYRNKRTIKQRLVITFFLFLTFIILSNTYQNIQIQNSLRMLNSEVSSLDSYVSEVENKTDDLESSITNLETNDLESEVSSLEEEVGDLISTQEAEREQKEKDEFSEWLEKEREKREQEERWDYTKKMLDDNPYNEPIIEPYP